MVDARLIFPHTALREVLEAFLSLPGELRPTHHRVGEDEPRLPIGDIGAFCDTKIAKKSGFLLHAKRVSYDLNPLGEFPIICNCFEIKENLAEKFLLHVAKARPTFGYCCTEEEEIRRNKFFGKIGINSIESWFGRDPEKNIPGLYWLTVIAEDLAKKHHVPLAALEAIALEHRVLPGGVHFFRFYEKASDWLSNKKVPELCASLPGLFDIGTVTPQITDGMTYREYMEELRKWK